MDENLKEGWPAWPMSGRPEPAPEPEPELSGQPEAQDQPDEPGQADAPETPEEATAGTQTHRDGSAARDLYMNVRVLVTMMAAFVLLFTFVVRIIVVSGPSMENTLIEGDLILVWSLGYNPKQGDIVVLTQESYQEDSIVKRVIATEGQRVDVDYDSNTVRVDGVPIEEDYIKERMFMPSWGEGINHVTVPEGCIFVMGDNRNMSADSRYPAIGIVDTRCVIGHGLLVLFPFNHWKGL